MVRTQTKILILLFAVLFVGFLGLSLYSAYSSVTASASTTDGLGTWSFLDFNPSDVYLAYLNQTFTFYARFISYNIITGDDLVAFTKLVFDFDGSGHIRDLFTASAYGTKNYYLIKDGSATGALPFGGLIYITDVTRGGVVAPFLSFFAFVSDNVTPPLTGRDIGGFSSTPNADNFVNTYGLGNPNSILEYCHFDTPSFSLVSAKTNQPFGLVSGTSYSVVKWDLRYVPGSPPLNTSYFVLTPLLSSLSSVPEDAQVDALYWVRWRFNSRTDTFVGITINSQWQSIGTFADDVWWPSSWSASSNFWSSNMRLISSAVSSDWSNGYDEGFIFGKDVGYRDGYSIGSSEGYQSGINAAFNSVNDKSASYTAGYNAGMSAAGDYTFLSLIGAVFDAPVNAFTEFFNFEVLGVNLTGLLSALFVVAIVVTILRLVLGG